MEMEVRRAEQLPYEVILEVTKNLSNKQRHQILFCLCRSFRNISLNTRASRFIHTRKVLTMLDSCLYVINKEETEPERLKPYEVSQADLSNISNILKFKNAILRIKDEKSLQKIHELNFISDFAEINFENEFSGENEDTVLDLQRIFAASVSISVEDSKLKRLKILLSSDTYILCLDDSINIGSSKIPVSIVSRIRRLFRLSIDTTCYNIEDLQNVSEIDQLWLTCSEPNEYSNDIIRKFISAVKIEKLQLSFDNHHGGILNLYNTKHLSMKVVRSLSTKFTLNFETETLELLSLKTFFEELYDMDLTILGVKKVKNLTLNVLIYRKDLESKIQVRLNLQDGLEIEKATFNFFTRQGFSVSSDLEIYVNYKNKFTINQVFFLHPEIGDGKGFNVTNITPTQLKITEK
jgi:hypothetical protein